MAGITQAFVLGAGLGTRLRPLTDDLPKPLVPIFQKSLITFAFDHLIELGVGQIFVNTHHLHVRFTEAFPDSTYRDRRIEFVHEPQLLETAGGIGNIADSLGNGPLLVYNGDVLTDLPVPRLIDQHFQSRNLVTLALRSGNGPKQIAFDPSSGRISDIRNQLGTGSPDEFVFTGIYIVERRFVDLLERGVKRSVIPHFLDLIRRGEKIGGVVLDDGNWWDVGNRDAYLQLHRQLSSGGDVQLAAALGKPPLLATAFNFPNYAVDDPDWRRPIHPSAIVDPMAHLRGCCVVARDCRVGPGAILQDTILWPGAQIASRSELHRSIVRTHRKVSGAHRNIDI
jgi:mannose-1-phosphate guanylyltransferase